MPDGVQHTHTTLHEDLLLPVSQQVWLISSFVFLSLLAPILGLGGPESIRRSRRENRPVKTRFSSSGRASNSSSTDFHFASPATSQYTPNRLSWSRFFHPFHPGATRAPRKGPALPPPGTGKPKSASFQAFSHTPLRPPSFLRPVCLPGRRALAARQGQRRDPSDPVYQRGVKLLLRTQHDDGSWLVKSRCPKLQPYFQSGFPYDHDQWISMAGTAWATIALTLAAEPAALAKR